MHAQPKIREQYHRRPPKSRRSIALAFAVFLAAITLSTPAGIPQGTPRLPDALQQWDPSLAAPVPESLNALKQGADHYAGARYADVLDILPASLDSKTLLLGDYIALYRGRANFMLERYQAASDEFRLLETQYPDSSRLRDAVLGQCQALLELKNPQPVLALLDKYKQFSSAETVYYRARALHLEGRKDAAIAQYLQIYSRYPDSQYSSLAEGFLAGLAPKALQRAANYGVRLKRAENLLRAKEVSRARTLLVALGRFAAPDTRTSQHRRLLMAEAEYNLNKTTAALASLKKVTAVDPVLHAKALYLEGACRRRLKQEQAFLALRDKALKLYPKSSDTEELCYSVATWYDVTYEPAKAQSAYQILLHAFPKGRHGERAQWKVALAAYFDGRYEEAARGFWNYLRTYTNPLYASSAMYWMGRCYGNLGAMDSARYLWDRSEALGNQSYYGQRAREAKALPGASAGAAPTAAADIDFAKVRAACEAVHFSLIQLPDPDIHGIRTLERARQLAAADMQDLALAELRWGTQSSPQNSKLFYYIMARISASRDNYNGVFAYLRNVYPDYSGRPADTLPQEAWQLLYPMHHWEAISKQAAHTDLDPALILGVIRQESAFKTNARSRANARGLMQLLPSTALRLARSAGMPRSRAGNLYDAETNIALGTRHLSYLLKRYGQTELALAAYNAGESRVERWLQEFGGADMAEFVEQIPFSETRNYVKQIASNISHYRTRIPQSISMPDRETEP